MAGRHSKSFFDFRKNTHTTPLNNNKTGVDTILLPYKIIIFVIVVSLFLSSFLIGRFFLQSHSNKKLLNNSKDIFWSLDSQEGLKTLSVKNKDIKGWIKIEGTGIDYAVCQSKDNKFYINHNQLGKKSRYGSLFLSCDDSFERNDNDKNIMILGNNMKDGTMFGALKKYRNLNFYKENPCVEIYYGDQAETYAVFAVMLLSATDSDGDNYIPTKSHFSNADVFSTWYNETKSRSLIDTTVDAKFGDDFLTLVTTADDFDGARLVVICKKVTEWDASHLDVSNAVTNSKIKYPKIWYTSRGLEYPY